MKLKFLEKLDGLVIERPVDFSYHGVRVQFTALIDLVPVSYTHLTLPTKA